MKELVQLFMVTTLTVAGIFLSIYLNNKNK